MPERFSIRVSGRSIAVVVLGAGAVRFDVGSGSFSRDAGTPERVPRHPVTFSF
jgi:hypothetical protein